jgi:hypothetical protein
LKAEIKIMKFVLTMTTVAALGIALAAKAL